MEVMRILGDSLFTKDTIGGFFLATTTMSQTMITDNYNSVPNKSKKSKDTNNIIPFLLGEQSKL